MSQVTPEEAGLAEFSPRGTSEHELQFLIAYYIKLLQTAGISIEPGDIEIGAVELKNSTTDDRATVDSSGALSTNVTKFSGTAAVTGSGTATGALRVELPTNGTGVVGLNAGTQIVGKVGIDQTTAGTTNLVSIISGQNGVAGGAGSTAATVQRVVIANDDPALPARVADNAVSTGNPDYVGGLAVAGSTYAPAYTAGDRAVLPVDKDSGGVLCHTRTLTTTDQVTSVPVANLASHISTATTTVVKSGSGTLERIVVNKHVATGVITVYDNTAASGTVLAIITTGAAVLTDPPITGIYGIPFSTGLTIVTSQAEDLTVVYR